MPSDTTISVCLSLKSASVILMTFLICVFFHGYLVRFECFDILTAGSFPKLSSDSSPSQCKLVSYIQSCQTKNRLPAASFFTVDIFSAPYTSSLLWPKQSPLNSGNSFFTQSVLQGLPRPSFKLSLALSSTACQTG